MAPFTSIIRRLIGPSLREIACDDRLAKCCTKCSGDKTCDGWQMGNYSANISSYSSCAFIKDGNLINQGKDMIGSVAKGGGGGGERSINRKHSPKNGHIDHTNWHSFRCFDAFRATTAHLSHKLCRRRRQHALWGVVLPPGPGRMPGRKDRWRRLGMHVARGRYRQGDQCQLLVPTPWGIYT